MTVGLRIQRGQLAPPVSLIRIVARRRPAAGKAFPAIDRFAGTGIEGNFGLLAALGTSRGIQLARRRAETALPAIATTAARGIPATGVTAAIGVSTGACSAAASSAVALGLACRPTVRATLGLGKTPLLIKLLLTQGEHEFLAAIAAGQRSITHPPEPLWPRLRRGSLERKQKRLTTRFRKIRHDDAQPIATLGLSL